ncbi:ketopantoate reductase PanE/ApbA C terminal-domain-containing protein [Kalaharituber pfeilii]|nr:ketopantoate reductase PanE/ApbA C terminal-domain-containing protein [Kalaharituber pfeilii]
MAGAEGVAAVRAPMAMLVSHPVPHIPTAPRHPFDPAAKDGGEFTSPPPPRIYIVGTGNIGCFVAHGLRSIHPRRPITLLMHRRNTAREFEENGSIIVVQHNRLAVSRKGFDVELNSMAIENLLPYSKTPPSSVSTPGDKIEHLIVTTKGHQVRAALEPLVPRLTPNATIAFIQNGMGIIDEVNSTYFSKPESRPNYIVGIATHGVASPKVPGFRPFTVEVNGIGTLKLGVIPSPKHQQLKEKDKKTPDMPPTTAYLLNSLLSCHDLVATMVSEQELLSTQLEKLAINAIINPLTAIFNCPNGALLNNWPATRTMKLLLWEVSQVVCALPELKHLPNRDLRFSAENLYKAVVRVARATAGNSSSMLQDIRKGIETEVDYINGYVVKKGLELGVPCSMNHLVQTMVKTKERMAKLERERELPIEGVERTEAGHR